MAKKGRSTDIILILGMRGTGKTTLEKELIKNELLRGGRALILVGDYAEYENIEEVHPEFPERIAKYKGVRKIVLTSSTAESTLNTIFDYYYNGLLVFEDFRAFTTASTTTALERLLVRSRHHMLDIIAVAHGPDRMPPAFFSYWSKLILFKTAVTFNVRKRYISDVKRFIQIQEQVNKKAESDIHYYEIHKV